MDNSFFDHPILNSPYKYPARHWELDKDGQPTQQIIERRRSAEFITPIPKPRKRKQANKEAGIQLEMVLNEGKGLSTSEQQYDPTTGQIRNASTDDIACWFIDTDYDGESFFVRHAYFTGAEEPYEKLKRALRAEVNEETWSALYSTFSRPFARPASGKIAVKVINHYGDEVLKVFRVK